MHSSSATFLYHVICLFVFLTVLTLLLTVVFRTCQKIKKQVTTDQERRPTRICPGARLFNIYISDLPTTVSRKYEYADDLAIMHADGDWQAVEGVLKDMATLSEYLQTWKLKLSTTKAVSTAFHLNNKEAKRELKVKYNNEILPFCSELKYLGVTLDRALTYR